VVVVARRVRGLMGGKVLGVGVVCTEFLDMT